MFTASTLFFAIQTILQNPSQRSNKAIQYFAWNIYVAILMLISMSRMFFACHFFHQCLFGAAFGIVIGRTLQSRRINNMIINLIRLEAFALAATVVLLTISIYFAHYLLASDPQWSIQKVWIQMFLFFIYILTDCCREFYFVLGVQLVQRSVFYKTRNNAALFIGSWVWTDIWFSIVFTACTKVNKKYWMRLTVVVVWVVIETKYSNFFMIEETSTIE